MQGRLQLNPSCPTPGFKHGRAQVRTVHPSTLKGPSRARADASATLVIFAMTSGSFFTLALHRRLSSINSSIALLCCRGCGGGGGGASVGSSDEGGGSGAGSWPKVRGAGSVSAGGGVGCRGGVPVGMLVAAALLELGIDHGSTPGGTSTPGGAGCCGVSVVGGNICKFGAGKVDAGSGTPSCPPSSITGFTIAARTSGGACSASPCKAGARMSLARTKFISRCGAESAYAWKACCIRSLTIVSKSLVCIGPGGGGTRSRSWTM